MKKFLIKRKLIKLQEMSEVYYKKKNPKILCVGCNKTGTTSVKTAFKDWGILVGKQQDAEMLAPYYHRGDFAPILDYCKTARFFQDVPFSWPETYRHVDEAFPNAKYILTVRGSSEEWFQSVRNFSIKRFGKVPSLEDKKNSTYVYAGWEYENHVMRCKKFGLPVTLTADDAEFKAAMIKEYEFHNQGIQDYFKDRPEKLLVINISEDNAYHQLCEFVGKRPKYDKFPWENKT